MREIQEVLAAQFFARVTNDGAARLVDAKELAGGLQVRDADGGVFECAAESLLALTQRFLSPLAVGDVDNVAQEADRLARGVAHGDATRDHPAEGTVLVAEPTFDFEFAGLAG